MYMGDNSFQSLQAFISGFLVNAPDKQLTQPGVPNFIHFSHWVQGHLDTPWTESYTWHTYIQKSHPGDDARSYEVFYYFLDTFKRSAVHVWTAPMLRRTIIDNSTTTFIEYLNENNEVIDQDWYLTRAKADEALHEKFNGATFKWVTYTPHAPHP